MIEAEQRKLSVDNFQRTRNGRTRDAFDKEKRERERKRKRRKETKRSRMEKLRTLNG